MSHEGVDRRGGGGAGGGVEPRVRGRGRLLLTLSPVCGRWLGGEAESEGAWVDAGSAMPVHMNAEAVAGDDRLGDVRAWQQAEVEEVIRRVESRFRHGDGGGGGVGERRGSRGGVGGLGDRGRVRVGEIAHQVIETLCELSRLRDECSISPRCVPV